MTQARLSLLSTALLTLSVSSHADQTSPLQGIIDKTPNFIALTGATVYTEPGKKLQNATVLIADGRISAVGVKVTVPAGYQQIDASRYTLYPGFIDPYTQYGIDAAAPAKPGSYRDAPQYKNDRKGGNASNGAIHAQQVWVNQFKPDAKLADELRNLGFTAAQSARFDGIFRGQAFVSALTEGLPNDLVLNAAGPQFMAFNKGSSKQSYPSSLMGSMALVRQTLSDANWYSQAYGKTDVRYFNQPIEFNAALQSLVNIKAQGAIFETADDRSLLRAHQLLNEFGIANAAMVGSGYEYVRLDEVKAMQRKLILPLNFPAAPAVEQLADQLDVNLAELRHWERAPANAAALANAGVPFALTTFKLKEKKDFWPNLRKAVEHGLPADTALAALTTVPASIAGVADKLGKIAPGYQADLVLASGDLFTDGEIVATWIRGQQHSIKAVTPVEFAGEYQLAVAGIVLKVTLTDEAGKLSGSAVLLAAASDAKAVKLEHLQHLQQQLQFNLNLAELTGDKQVAQFSGQLRDNRLTGKWQQGGATETVSAQRQLSATESKKPAEEAKADSSLISQLTFPNRAYGLPALVKQQNVHIKNATVWTAEDAGVLQNTDVIVRDGKFEKIGKNLSTPAGFTVIDASGMHLTPGMIDEHSHVAIEAGVNEGTDAVTSEVRIGDVLNPEDINLYRGLAGGTTTAQLLHGSANPIGGQAQVIQFRWGENAQGLKMQAAPPSIKFALGENVKQSNWGDAFTERYPQTRIGVETTIRDAFVAAKEYKARLAAYNKLSKRQREQVAAPRIDYRLEALVEILDKQRFIHTHSYVASEILMLIELADEMGFSITTFTHILEGYKTAKEMAAHGASASTFADWWAYKMEVQDAIPTNACLMAQQGVNVSINSDDAGLQRRLNQEAAKSVMYCGMSEHDALKMVTINPAMQLKIDGVTGSIKAGKQADFVLWNTHPLSVYSQAQQTWIAGGKYFDINTDKQLQQQLASEKAALIQKVLTAGDKAKAGDKDAYKQDEPEWHCEDQGDWWQIGSHIHGLNHHHNHSH
ncbi:MAG: amidohydrolase family protein [Gammaproteobacteria bacterium]|nr:amidohydrolase family protein [Gammaproteobacteria bacterium]MBU1557309.1 amidohydrolase family protein [Gammaproteobacteria bacterium]MBU2069322.1 amidohydrolase family protein [Gammaproteobacteria bacterium]MBU2183375.1 amidohydrolase family protein [Gammaproteobacteria bacterium]MBU2204532.1 amidohydrolase family protein [Gammaproteobacteria bacterium]